MITYSVLITMVFRRDDDNGMILTVQVHHGVPEMPSDGGRDMFRSGRVCTINSNVY